MAKCLFDGEKECLVMKGFKGKIDLPTLAQFCQACIQLQSIKALLGQLQFYRNQVKYAKASMILGLLQTYQDEKKAREVYDKILKYAEEWETTKKETSFK